MYFEDLKQMINFVCDKHKDKAAFKMKENEKIVSVSYSQFKNDIDSFGSSLIDMGLKDSFIALIGENRYEWCVSYLSVVNGAGVIVPFDKELNADEIGNLLKQCRAKAVIYSDKLKEKIKNADTPYIEYFINMDIKEHTKDELSFDKMLTEGRELIKKGFKDYTDIKIIPNKMRILLYTSGTTGVAKGVMLCHRNICSNITGVKSAVKLYDSDVTLSILPLHHTYECTCGFLIVMECGGTVSFCQGLKYISQNIKEFKPTALICVPLIIEGVYKKIWDQASKKKFMKTILKILVGFNGLLQLVNLDLSKVLFKKIHQNMGGRLRLVISGASAIDPEISKIMFKMGIKIIQGYGLTECSPILTVNYENDFKHASIGKPLPDVELDIYKPDKNKIGEIIAKGPNIMLGYHNNEEETNKVMRKGWFHTGDIGYKDKNGFYYITGRKKNIIVAKNGENVYPEEIETILNRSPLILESLVCQEHDNITEENTVCAHILPDLDKIKESLGESKTTKEVVEKLINDEVKQINRNLSIYKKIRKVIIRDTEFVKTSTKKIKRFEI